MRRISTLAAPALVILGACGKYGSRAEAEIACRDWANKGGYYIEAWQTPNDTREITWQDSTGKEKSGWEWIQGEKKTKKIGRRRCQPENETNQLLGLESSFNKDQVVERPKQSEYNVRKHFRF